MGEIKNDLTGERFGRLTVLEYAGKNKWHNSLWRCKCTCGNETIVISSGLKSGKTRSCGCVRKDTCRETGLNNQVINRKVDRLVMRELKASNTPWREALKNSITSKPSPTGNGNYTICPKINGKTSYKTYPDYETALAKLYEFAEKNLVDSLQAYGLNPNNAIVFMDLYLVFDNGMIFNMRGRKCNGHIDSNGYLTGSFDRQPMQVHRVIASLFVPKINPIYKIVAHKDGDKLNNAASNLKWTNKTEIWADLIENDTLYRMANAQAKLTEQMLDPDELRRMLPKIGMTLRKRSKFMIDNQRHDCVVTYVNPRGLWFEVQFTDDFGGGFKECFKLPEKTPGYAG